MCGSKTTAQQNTSQTYQPPPDVLANYDAVTSQAKGVAATPYSAYGGELVAPVNSQQGAGIAAVNDASGIQNPYNAGAMGLASASAGTIDPDAVSTAQIQQYESPYQSDVINATEAQIQNQNQQQAAALQGNTIASGAFGGDRAGIAQAALANQQDLAEGQTIAGLENQNYTQALGEANTQQQANLTAQEETAQNRNAAAGTIAGIGNTAQTEALNEANAQTNAGTLEQTTQQAQDQASYNQFLQQAAYPFETTGWLANIVEGIGSQSGGTTTGDSTTEGSLGSSILGGILGGVGIASKLNRGGRVEPERGLASGIHRAAGGIVARRADGGALNGGGIYFPQYDPTGGSGPTGLGGGAIVSTVGGLAIGNTMPKGIAPKSQNVQTPQQQAQSIADTARDVEGAGNGIGSLYSKLTNAGSPTDISNGFGGTDLGVGAADPTESFGDFGGIYSRGGLVSSRIRRRNFGGIVARRHYDDGGTIPIDPEALLFDPDATAGAPSLVPGSAAINTPIPLAASDSLAAPTIDAPLPTTRPTGNSVPAAADYGTFVPTQPPPPTPTATGIASSAVAPSGGIVSGAAGVGIAAPMQIAPREATPPLDTSGLNPQARGLRNNNPGNLVDNSWTQSLPGYSGSDGRFAIFSSPQAGQSALDRNLQSYGAKGVSTPLQIASRWAPAGDGNNNPESYAGVIARKLGIGINDPINLGDPAQRAQVGSAIALVENGNGISRGTSTGGAGLASAASGALEPLGQVAPGSAAGQNTPNGIAGFLSNLFGGGSNQQSAGGEPRSWLGLTPDQSTELLDVGLGIAGGTSRSMAANIGQGGLAGINAYNANRMTGADIALKSAQASSAQTESQIKQQQLQLMMSTLDKIHDIFQPSQPSGQPSARSSGSAPTLTAPTISTPGPSSSASATNGQPAGSPAPATPTAAAAKAIDPQYDPAKLRLAAEYYAQLASVKPEYATAAQNARDQAEAIESGRAMVRFSDGSYGLMPGYVQSQTGLEGAKTGAKEAVKSQYDLVSVQPQPGGPTYLVPKSQLVGAPANVQNSVVQPGAGTVNPMDQYAAQNPTVASQPAFIEKRQEQLADNENEMVQQFQARQLSRQRLQALEGVMKNYQPGAFAQQKADIVANLRSIGIPVPDSATANPTAFQEFMKNATANVFNDIKSQGGRTLVSEIDGFTKANANPELQPAAAAAIIGQGIGVLDYEDQHFKDYSAWKRANPYAYNTADFETQWVQNHPVQQFVSQANKGIAYSGQQIPPPGQRVVGQAYLNSKGQKATWTGAGWQAVP